MIDKTWTGYAFVSLVEFLVDWLISPEVPEEEFSGVGAVLAAMPRKTSYPYVFDQERQFPVRSRNCNTIIQKEKFPFPDYLRVIMPRLIPPMDLGARGDIVVRIAQQWEC